MKDGRWRAHKMISGARKTKLFATKSLAKKWEAEQNQEDWQKEQDTTPTTCLHDVATLYLDYSQSRHSKKTFEGKQLSLKRLFLYVSPDISPESISMKAALEALTGIAKRTGNATANGVRKNLSAFWEYGKKYHGFPLLNPFQQIERFPEKPEHHYVPPIEDFWRVYETADTVDRTMLLTLLHTAARRSEVLQLTWNDVDFQKRKIRLSTCKTRDGSRKQVWLSMTARLHAALVEHKVRQKGHGQEANIFLSKRTGETYVDRKHFTERLCRKAGVRPFGYHGIRGLSATVLAQAGVPLPEIQKILRHANMTTTELYVRALGVSTDMLSEAFDKMEAAPKVLPFRAVR
jgi:integrase